jgi:hypothetical protein
MKNNCHRMYKSLFKDNPRILGIFFYGITLIFLCGCREKAIKQEPSLLHTDNLPDIYPHDTIDYDTIDPYNYCTVEMLSIPYIKGQDITITDMQINRNSNNNSMYDSLGLLVEFYPPYTLRVKYENVNKKFILYTYWPDTTDGSHWSPLRMRKVATSKRKYLNIEFRSPLEVHREYCNNLFLDITNWNKIEVYAPPETLYAGLKEFGDFDHDSYLDFVMINDSLMRLQMYSLKNGQKYLNKNIYIQLDEVRIPSYFPVYKASEKQKNIDFWKK